MIEEYPELQSELRSHNDAESRELSVKLKGAKLAFDSTKSADCEDERMYFLGRVDEVKEFLLNKRTSECLAEDLPPWLKKITNAHHEDDADLYVLYNGAEFVALAVWPFWMPRPYTWHLVKS